MKILMMFGVVYERVVLTDSLLLGVQNVVDASLIGMLWFLTGLVEVSVVDNR